MSDNDLHMRGPLGDLIRQGHAGAVRKLVEAWGGTHRYIPREPPPDGFIAITMSMDAARALGQMIGGEHYSIPSPASLKSTVKALILEMTEGTREVAQALGCSERYVRHVRSEGGIEMPPRTRPVDTRQLNMFE